MTRLPGSSNRRSEHHDIVIIGSGFGGLGAAIKLRGHGFADVVILEKADDVGGTWRDNSYPGCACDVPSHLYSFSFALNPDWTDTFSGQAEIWAYLRHCAHHYGLIPKIRFGHEVTGAAWDDASGYWRIQTDRGWYTARVLIAASGPLSEPSLPDIDGLDEFAGTLFHSARWRHDHDLTGRRVAVIGTGASSAQFIPQIQPKVGHLTLFQRTPAWVMPRRTRPVTRAEKTLYRNVPGAQRAARTAIYWGRETWTVGFLHPRINRLAQRLSERLLRRQVGDADLRAKLRPDYLMGCKRVVLSNDYWPALTRDNVTVVTEKIRCVEPDAVVTTDGARHPVDTIIAGTGFRATDPPVMSMVRGRDAVPLADAWTPTLRAHKGTAVAGFPNFFVLLGPNTGLGHSSVVLMIEAQITQIVKALGHLRRTGGTTIEPRAESQRRYNETVDRAMTGTVWTSGGCNSWYLDSSGRNSTIWPGFVTGFRLRASRFDATEYEVR